MLFVPSFQSKNRKWCFLGIHPNFSQSNGSIIELSIWVKTLLKFKFLLQPRDPQTARSRSVRVFQNNVGPGLLRDWIFFLGPVPGLELYPGPSWSLKIYGLGPVLEFLISSGTGPGPTRSVDPFFSHWISSRIYWIFICSTWRVNVYSYNRSDDITRRETIWKMFWSILLWISYLIKVFNENK